MNLFKNIVQLRGFLGKNVEVPSSRNVTNHSYAVLTLCIESGVWVKSENYWLAETAELTIICPGPYFCGLVRGMRQGEYLDVDAILRAFEYPEPVVISVDPLQTKTQGIELYATSVRRVEYPAVLVDEGLGKSG